MPSLRPALDWLRRSTPLGTHVQVNNVSMHLHLVSCPNSCACLQLRCSSQAPCTWSGICCDCWVAVPSEGWGEVQQ